MTPSPGTPPPSRRRGLAAATLLAVGAATAAAAQTGVPAETPESLQQKLEAGRGREAVLNQQLTTGLQEEKLLKEDKRSADKKLKEATQRLIAAAARLQGKEASLTALEWEIADLDVVQAKQEAELDTRLRQRGAVLSAILRIARHPPKAMMLLPAPPIDTVRGLMVFRHMEPTLRDEAARLEDRLTQLAAVRADTARKREREAKAANELKVDRDNLEGLKAERAALVEKIGKTHDAKVRQNRATASELIEQVKGIRGLIELIEKRKRESEEAARQAAQEAPETQLAAAAIPKPVGLLDFTREKGSLWPPVQGRVVRRYGEKDEFGAISKGIVLEGRAGAQVVAPFDGEVVFAGPFRGYGRILLIEHGGGYHTLLAGLGRIDSVPGQWLLAGEPVAVMDDADADGTRLYVEFRRNGRPINPHPYLAVAQNRTSG